MQRMIFYLHDTFQKFHSYYNFDKALGKPRFKDIFHNTWPVFVKLFKIVINKKSPGNGNKLEESKGVMVTEFNLGVWNGH